jgi:hypothetical protein
VLNAAQTLKKEPLKNGKEMKNMAKTEETKIEYQEVTIKISKPFLNAMLSYLNKCPYYKDLQEFILEARTLLNIKNKLIC